MNGFALMALVILAALVIGAAGALLYAGGRSPLRPVFVFVTGWGLVFRRLPDLRRTTAAIALVIGSGAALQLLSTSFPLPNETMLAVASIAWQAVMYTAVAALAVNVHLFVIHDVLAPRRFGTETPFYRSDAMNQTLHPRRPGGTLLAWAAGIGFVCWVVIYGLAFASNAAVRHAPALLPVLDPGSSQLVVFIVTSIVSFVVTTPLVLIRPALSFGSRKPFLLGLRMATANAPALYLFWILLLLPPAVVGALVALVPSQVFPDSTTARALGALVFLVFSIFQTLAVEICTVLFMNRAMNLSAAGETRLADTVAPAPS